MKHNAINKITSALLMLSGSAVAVAAEDKDVFNLGQIDVVASLDSEVSSAQISQQQMRQNQITNVAQTANITSGVFFERKGGRGEQNILVRGFDSLRVPVFIDGIPVYVPYDGNIDLGRFTTFDLAQIDIAKGASSVLYGANTLGGAINLVSRKPTNAFEGVIGYGFRTGRNAHTDGNQVYFNLGSQQELFYAQLSGSWLDNQGMQLSKDFQVVNNDEDGGRAENSKNRDKKLSLKLAYTPNQTDEYALSLATQKGTKQQPYYAGTGTASSRYKYWQWPQWDKDSIYFLSHTELGSGEYYVNSKVFYDTFKNELDLFDDNTLSSKSTSYYRDHSYGAGLEFGANLSEHNLLKLTTLYKVDVHKEHNDDEPVARNEDRNYSIGLEDTHHFTDRTYLVAGISFDRREAKSAQNYQQLSENSSQKGIYHFDVGNRNAFNYQLKLGHSFDNRDELSFSFAHKTRFPTMKDRYSRSLGRYRTPNPYLKPEVADHFEIAYARQFNDGIKVEGALFHSRVRDAIQEVATGQTKRIQGSGSGTGSGSGNRQGRLVEEMMNQNVGTEIFQGIELAVEAKLNDRVKVGANYTYMHTKNKHTHEVVRHVPKHKVFAYVDLNLTPQLSLYLSQLAETGRYGYDGSKQVRLPGFGTTDVKLGYAFSPQLNVDVGVSNLFDKNYFYVEGYPEEGRIYFANLQYRF